MNSMSTHIRYHIAFAQNSNLIRALTAMSTGMDRLVRLQLSFQLFPKGDKCVVFHFPVHCPHFHHCILVATMQRRRGSIDVIFAAIM